MQVLQKLRILGEARNTMKFWQFKKKISKVDLEKENINKRYNIVESFAKIGDYVEYLGVKMLVVGYHDWYLYGYPQPSLRVEWMDTCKHLQQTSISDSKLVCCKHISTSENNVK